MQVNLIGCIFVGSSEKNTNIRKNDIKKIKIVLDKDNKLPICIYDQSNMKEQIRKHIFKIINTKLFHLEQVFTMDYKDSIDIIYLALTNQSNINNINKDYKLVDFNIINNSNIVLDNNNYSYKTKEVESNNNIEYIHDINVKDNNLKRDLLNILIAYKRLRSQIDNSDILFKLVSPIFTLEDVKNIYELVKDINVDKSNFRKKIIKYCSKVDETDSGGGFRPSQKYIFKPLKGDVWL